MAYRGLFPLSDEKLKINLLCEERVLPDFSKASLMVPKASLGIGIQQLPYDVNGVGAHVRRELHLAFYNLLEHNLRDRRNEIRELDASVSMVEYNLNPILSGFL